MLCPCWIGEDPDNGTCESVLAYDFDKGEIDGLDVSGVTFAMAGRIPGNGPGRARVRVHGVAKP